MWVSCLDMCVCVCVYGVRVASRTSARPLVFRYAKKEVVPGLEIGVASMKLVSDRLIPPHPCILSFSISSSCHAATASGASATNDKGQDT